MKRFILKIFLLINFSLIILLFIVHFDTFNVFHWNSIRFTSAEPNKNFIKTKYIINNPDNYNAFIFGSSRVWSLPPNSLPKTYNSKELNWYNMGYSIGLPSEHLLTIESFLKNNVKIDMIILGFDDMAMYNSIETHKKDLLRMPFQIYEDNLFSFYLPYIRNIPNIKIINEISTYKYANHEDESKIFYEFGVSPIHLDLSIGPKIIIEDSSHNGQPFSHFDSYQYIEEIVKLCKQNNIKLILFTNPLYQTTYKDCVDNGYFVFLRQVAENCEFYNFSSLNNFSKDSSYYFESSHYRPILGNIIEKFLFGTEEERKQIIINAGDNNFGQMITSENANYVITELEKQLP